MLLSDGVSPNAVAEYLGHDDPGFTLRVYGHLLLSAPARMCAAIDAALAPDSRVSGDQSVPVQRS
jgi:integrase